MAEDYVIVRFEGPERASVYFVGKTLEDVVAHGRQFDGLGNPHQITESEARVLLVSNLDAGIATIREGHKSVRLDQLSATESETTTVGLASEFAPSAGESPTGC